MGNFTGGEFIIILIVALVVLGPERLPEMARSAGKALHKLKTMADGLGDDVKGVMDDPSMQPLKELGELAARPRQKLAEYALEAEAEERARKEAAAQEAADAADAAADAAEAAAAAAAEAAEAADAAAEAAAELHGTTDAPAGIAATPEPVVTDAAPEGANTEGANTEGASTEGADTDAASTEPTSTEPADPPAPSTDHGTTTGA